MSKKKIIIIIVLVVLIAIASGSAWYLFNGGKNGEDAKSDTSAASTTKSNTPASTKDIATLIDEDSQLTSFSKLLTITGVITSLKSTGTSGSMTYIALIPNNDAVKNLPKGYYDSLLTAQKQSSAIDIAKYHVAQVASDILTDGQKLKTVEGQEVIVNVSGGQYKFTDAKGTTTNASKAGIKAANGTLFVIDSVLLPQ